jgi:hypothetical protein
MIQLEPAGGTPPTRHKCGPRWEAAGHRSREVEVEVEVEVEEPGPRGLLRGVLARRLAHGAMRDTPSRGVASITGSSRDPYVESAWRAFARELTRIAKYTRGWAEQRWRMTVPLRRGVSQNLEREPRWNTRPRAKSSRVALIANPTEPLQWLRYLERGVDENLSEGAKVPGMERALANLAIAYGLLNLALLGPCDRASCWAALWGKADVPA